MLEGESATVEVRADPSDRAASVSAPKRGSVLGSRTPLLLATVIFALTVTFGRDFLYNQFGVPFGVAATAASIAGMFFFLIILNIFAYLRKPNPVAPRDTGPRNFTLTAEPGGLHLVAGNMAAHYQWRGILQLSDTDTHMYINTDGAQTIAVPKRCFESREHASRFAIIVRSHIGKTA